jgi:hypothetical protein
MLPISTPSQFEPELLRASIERLLAAEPLAIYLTHFGRVADVPRQGRRLLVLLDSLVAVGRRHANAADRHRLLKQDMAALYATILSDHGVAPTPAALELLAMDIELNAQGMGLWLDRAARSAAS